MRTTVGAVIGREGFTAMYLTLRGACFAATDRSHHASQRGSGHRPRRVHCDVPDTVRRVLRGHGPLPRTMRTTVGAVIGREGLTAIYLTLRGACIAATDRSHVRCEPTWERSSAAKGSLRCT